MGSKPSSLSGPNGHWLPTTVRRARSPSRHPNRLSFPTSLWQNIFEAFLAAYSIIRRPKKSLRDSLYLRTLPADKQCEEKGLEEVGSEDVRRVLTRTIQMLRNPSQKRRRPILAVRNLYTLLDEEKFSNIEKLNEVLWSHWAVLWRVCARGHYSLHRTPLREKVSAAELDEEDFETAFQPALPLLEEGGYRLDLVREEGNEFSLRLHFPGPFATRYPVVGYARIAEFRRMLEDLNLAACFVPVEGLLFFQRSPGSLIRCEGRALPCARKRDHF